MNTYLVLEFFEQFNIFVRDVYNGTVTLKEADEDKSSLLVEIMNFKKKIKPPNPEKKQKKPQIFSKTYMHFLMVEKELLMFLKAKYFKKQLKI